MKMMVFLDGGYAGEFEVKLPEHLKRERLDGAHVHLVVKDDRSDDPAARRLLRRNRLRACLAGRALQGILAGACSRRSFDDTRMPTPSEVAREVIRYADAVLEALEGEGG